MQRNDLVNKPMILRWVPSPSSFWIDLLTMDAKRPFVNLGNLLELRAFIAEAEAQPQTQAEAQTQSDYHVNLPLFIQWALYIDRNNVKETDPLYVAFKKIMREDSGVSQGLARQFITPEGDSRGRSGFWKHMIDNNRFDLLLLMIEKMSKDALLTEMMSWDGELLALLASPLYEYRYKAFALMLRMTEKSFESFPEEFSKQNIEGTKQKFQEWGDKNFAYLKSEMPSFFNLLFYSSNSDRSGTLAKIFDFAVDEMAIFANHGAFFKSCISKLTRLENSMALLVYNSHLWCQYMRVMRAEGNRAFFETSTWQNDFIKLLHKCKGIRKAEDVAVIRCLMTDMPTAALEKAIIAHPTVLSYLMVNDSCFVAEKLWLWASGARRDMQNNLTISAFTNASDTFLDRLATSMWDSDTVTDDALYALLSVIVLKEAFLPVAKSLYKKHLQNKSEQDARAQIYAFLAEKTNKDDAPERSSLARYLRMIPRSISLTNPLKYVGGYFPSARLWLDTALMLPEDNQEAACALLSLPIPYRYLAQELNVATRRIAEIEERLGISETTEGIEEQDSESPEIAVLSVPEPALPAPHETLQKDLNNARRRLAVLENKLRGLEEIAPAQHKRLGSISGGRG